MNDKGLLWRCGLPGLAAWLVFLSLDGWAQEHDPFALLDQLDSPPVSLTWWQEVRHNALFQLVTRGMAYYREPEAREGVDDGAWVADGRFHLETAWARRGHRLKGSAWLEWGTQQATYSQKAYRAELRAAPFAAQRRRRYLELDELFWSYNGVHVDLTAGKKYLRLGKAPLYSPVDRLNPVDFNDPLEARRHGSWLLAIDYYAGRMAASLTLLPVFIPSKIPGIDSRWVSSQLQNGALLPADFQFFTLPVDPLEGLEEKLPDGLSQVQIIAQLKTIAHGWDLFLVGGSGVAPHPVLRVGDPVEGVPSLVRQYIRAATVGAGFSTVSGRFEFHGEAFYQHSSGGRDDDYLAAVGGVTSTFDHQLRRFGFERLELTVDYVREAIVDPQQRPGYLASSEIVRMGRHGILASISGQPNVDWRLNGVAHLDLEDEGRLVVAGCQYRPAPGLWLKGRSEFFWGPQDSFYGRWQRNDRLVFSVDYSF